MAVAAPLLLCVPLGLAVPLALGVPVSLGDSEAVPLCVTERVAAAVEVLVPVGDGVGPCVSDGDLAWELVSEAVSEGVRVPLRVGA